MTSTMNRRQFGLAALTAMGTRALPARAASTTDVDGAAIAAIEARYGGRLGVFARDTGIGRTIAHRADERFLMKSTFKGPLAAMVLAGVDDGRDALDRPIGFGPHDLVDASPVTAAHVAVGTMTVGALVQAILERSDNTAANLLLRRAGGPIVLTSWLRASGDRDTVVNRYEILPGQTGPENTTTPRAIAATAARISLGQLLQPTTRSLNNRWMAANSLAMQRLRGGLPPDWAGLDRTGTDDNNRDDYAVVWPPGRSPLVIAAYYEKPDLPDGAGETVLRAVGGAIASWARTG